MGVSEDARREGRARIDPKRKADILRAMGTDRLTARQIANRLGYSDLNTVKPRLTELCSEGRLRKLPERQFDPVTGVHVTVYEVRYD